MTIAQTSRVLDYLPRMAEDTERKFRKRFKRRVAIYGISLGVILGINSYVDNRLPALEARIIAQFNPFEKTAEVQRYDKLKRRQ